jgi:hypothetical protein
MDSSGVNSSSHSSKAEKYQPSWPITELYQYDNEIGETSTQRLHPAVLNRPGGNLSAPMTFKLQDTLNTIGCRKYNNQFIER